MSDVINKQLVAVRGDKIIVMMPAHEMSKAEALVHAAYLVALADDNDVFNKILEEVQST